MMFVFVLVAWCSVLLACWLLCVVSGFWFVACGLLLVLGCCWLLLIVVGCWLVIVDFLLLVVVVVAVLHLLAVFFCL